MQDLNFVMTLVYLSTWLICWSEIFQNGQAITWTNIDLLVPEGNFTGSDQDTNH